MTNPVKCESIKIEEPKRGRKRLMRTLICFIVVCLMPGQIIAKITFSDAYRSPRNAERPVRKTTTLIILHNTETRETKALSTIKGLSDRGECHYVVNTDGVVYRIVDRNRKALHTGRSMWNGRSNVSDFSVGIEVVGKAVSPPNAKQIHALKALIKELQATYKIPDECVLSHAHVSYTTPNKWHKRNSRGRKTCGKLFGTWNIRKQLDLAKKPAFDPDVRTGRVASDPELYAILYATTPVAKVSKDAASDSQTSSSIITAQRSAWSIARDQYDQSTTIYVFPNGARKSGDQISDWSFIPVGTRVILSEDAPENAVEPVRILGQNATSATAIARDEARSASTFYILPQGKVYSGAKLTTKRIASLPKGTRILVGYAKVGPTTPTTNAYKLCGLYWNAKDTYYLYPNGLLKSGYEIDETKIPAGIFIFYKR